MSRSGMTVMCAAVLLSAATASAQTPLHGYIEGVTGQTRTATSAGVYGAGIGVYLTSDLRIGGELGRMENIVPDSISSRVGDGLPAEAGLQLTPRMSAAYGTGGLTYQLPIRGRVRPYLQASLGIAQMTTRLDVAGNGPTALAIRAATHTQAPTTHLLAQSGIGVNVRLVGRAGLELGYRMTKLFDNDVDIQASQFHTAVTLGF